MDRQLNFDTRTLLCVPLRGIDGEIFGAFEVINKENGNFHLEDEEALTELAAHAAVALENTQEREQLVSTQRHLAEEAAAG
ncbi:MAG: GAF domain-containing protein, partial [Pirellulaceae bacterium]|nr:GAF domain-containing protein [Pirellulaceae bacterium]